MTEVSESVAARTSKTGIFSNNNYADRESHFFKVQHVVISTHQLEPYWNFFIWKLGQEVY